MKINIPDQFPTLTTERLILRQLSINDDKEIFRLRSDENVNKYLDREKSLSIEDARGFINKILDNSNKNEGIYWAITFNNSDKLIGTICYFNFSKEHNKAEIGYELLPEYQGKGIMTETIAKVIEFGFQRMGLTTIEACTHKKNESSIGLLKKFNFKINENYEDSTNKDFIMLQLINLI